MGKHLWQITTNTMAVWKCTKCGATGFAPNALPTEGCKPQEAIIADSEGET